MNIGFVVDANAEIDAKLNSIIEYIVKNGITEEYNEGNEEFAQELCLLGGFKYSACASDYGGVDTMAEGICVASKLRLETGQYKLVVTLVPKHSLYMNDYHCTARGLF